MPTTLSCTLYCMLIAGMNGDAEHSNLVVDSGNSEDRVITHLIGLEVRIRRTESMVLTHKQYSSHYLYTKPKQDTDPGRTKRFRDSCNDWAGKLGSLF
ncbi:hypothetical protein BD410DRAFT_793385, partial [Rickenella mellea]